MLKSIILNENIKTEEILTTEEMILKVSEMIIISLLIENKSINIFEYSINNNNNKCIYCNNNNNNCYYYNNMMKNIYCYKCIKSISILSIIKILPLLNHKLFIRLMKLLDNNIICGLNNTIYKDCKHNNEKVKNINDKKLSNIKIMIICYITMIKINKEDNIRINRYLLKYIKESSTKELSNEIIKTMIYSLKLFPIEIDFNQWYLTILDLLKENELQKEEMCLTCLKEINDLIPQSEMKETLFKRINDI